MGLYTCHFCSYSGTLLEVVTHNRNVHVSDRNEKTNCCICSRRQKARYLRLHIRHRHPTDCTVRCTSCSEPFVAEIDMRNHLRNGCKRTTAVGTVRIQDSVAKPVLNPQTDCTRSSNFTRGSPVKINDLHLPLSIPVPLYSTSTLPAGFDSFLNTCRPADISEYISQHLQPDQSFSDECSSVVDHVAEFFKRRPGFTVNRFIKGGSLGKGTAIKSKSDIDCVMFVSELPSIDSDDYHDELQDLLKQMEETLLKSKSSIAYNLEVVGRTSHAVKLRVQTQKRDHESHDVDLLLATDLLGPVPSSAKKEEVYDRMGRMRPRDRENCSAALVELQRDFVRKQSDDVKNLIRLVKMWKKSCVGVTSLTSYPLELLCIHVWQSHYSVASAFKAVLEKLRDYDSICAYWTDNYSYSRVANMLHKRRLILDPANPYNNVADRCSNWSAVSRAARETLQKPFFRR